MGSVPTTTEGSGSSGSNGSVAVGLSVGGQLSAACVAGGFAVLVWL